MRISDWSSDVCSSDLTYVFLEPADGAYHRLGVSNGFDLPGPSLDENIRRIGEVPLSYEPGADWGYSMAMDVLGAVVTTVEGTTLPEAVKHLVTEPLGMTDTGFHVADRHRLVTHYGDGEPEPVPMADDQTRSEERREGKEGVSTCRTRGS